MTTYRWMLAHIPPPVPRSQPVYPEQDWPRDALRLGVASGWLER